MAVITISRQLGSLGCEVADEVVQRLGYRKAWRGLINQAARRARTPEMALEMLDELGLFGIEPSLSVEKEYLDAICELIEELARDDNIVIVGRGGQAVLQDWPDTLHVRVIAPLEVRVNRLVDEQGISKEAALAQIQTSDRRRERFVERAYHVNWSEPSLYDLVLNTATLDVPKAAELICLAVTSMVETK
ncbi:MAG: cytidylate kinase-like family protein [Anaerolineales bacterium]|jgi:cytidylate kinase